MSPEQWARLTPDQQRTELDRLEAWRAYNSRQAYRRRFAAVLALAVIVIDAAAFGWYVSTINRGHDPGLGVALLTFAALLGAVLALHQAPSRSRVEMLAIGATIIEMA